MLKKIIFITGANSFLGQSVAQILSKKGFVIYGCCRNVNSINDPSNYKKLLPYSTLDLPINLLPKEIDILLHCEGQSSVLNSFEFQSEFKSYNFKLIEKIKKIVLQSSKKVHVIFPSSAAVYGQNDSCNLEEQSNLKPVSPYGIEKAYFEESLKTFSFNHSIQCSIIRFFSLFGPSNKKQLIWEAYCRLKSSEKPIFFGTGNEVRDFFFISDAINLIEYLIKYDKKFIIVNGGTGIGTTINNIIYKIRDIIKTDKNIIFNQVYRTGDPYSLIASNLLLSKIGFVAKVSLDEGLKYTISGYEKN